LALAKVLLELPRGIETGVATADDKDPGHALSHRGRTPRDQRLGERGVRADRMRRTAAVTPSATSIPAPVRATSGSVPYNRVSSDGRRAEGRLAASAGGSGG